MLFFAARELTSVDFQRANTLRVRPLFFRVGPVADFFSHEMSRRSVVCRLFEPKLRVVSRRPFYDQHVVRLVVTDSVGS